MKYCSKCGAQMPDEANFCISCGEAFAKAEEETQKSEGETPKTEETPKAESETKSQDTEFDFKNTWDKINDTPDTTYDYEKTDVDKNKGMAVLSYLGLLFLIPLFAAKDSKYARFHLNQGIVFFIASAIYSSVIALIEKIVEKTVAVFAETVSSSFAALVALPLNIVLAVAAIVPLVLMIIGIVNAAKGKAKELPVIGKYRILK